MLARGIFAWVQRHSSRIVPGTVTLMVTGFRQPHVIVVRIHAYEIDFVIFTPEKKLVQLAFEQ